MPAGLDSVLALAVLLLGSTAGPRPPGDGHAGERLRFTVRISDHASVPAASLARAKAVATHVFDAIGVEPAWRECPPGQAETVACAERPRPTDLFVMIVPKPMAARARVSAMMGLAVLPDRGRGSHLYVFNDRVRALSSEQQEVEFAVILGHVLAHEIGHLLLGSNSHSSGGIMAARWFARELRRLSKGDLLFTAEEPLRIRTELLARTAEETRIGSNAR
jgi:hypothetical protein